MTPCSISNVMYQPSVSDWQPAWVRFFWLVVQRENVLRLPNSEIMIHQPSGGAKGQATEIQIAAENILKTKKRLNEILAANTGKPYETIAADTERDNYMSAQEAADYGLIDGVITNR